MTRSIKVNVVVSIGYAIPDSMSDGEALAEIDLNWHSILTREARNGAFSGPTDIEVDDWGYSLSKQDWHMNCMAMEDYG